jgi:hypothetical protein
VTLFSTELPGRLLARFALQGLMTLEDLDSPTTYWNALEADRRVANNRAQRQGRGHVFPPPNNWSNLAREWIAQNPSEWESMLRDTLARESSGSPDPTSAIQP